MDLFKKLHPTVLLIFFTAVLFLTMLTANPLFLVISFVCALLSNAFFQKPKRFLTSFVTIILMIILITITNPLFNRHGATVLFNIGRIAITKESLIKGFSVGLMLGAVILWFNVFNEVMTADKFYYLFGRVAPTITLVLTMGLRFIPLMVKQMRNIEEGQKGLGLLTQTSFLKKLKHYLRMFSILLTWSLEHALETADAMKSRGYGLKPRTSFSSFSFHRQDLGSLIYLLLFFSIVVSGEFLNIYAFSFFPNLSNFQFGIRELIGYLSFSLLGIFPLILVIKEALIWRYWMLKM